MRTAERLLELRSLAEISVDDLAQGAGLSRSAFYFYFPSKDAVVLSLVDRMVEEAAAVRDDAVQKLTTDAGTAWREGIEGFYAVFGAHRPVVRAITDLSATNVEARELRSQIMEGWVAHVTEQIQSERDRGAAPVTSPTRDLAIVLVQMNERVLQALFIDESPAVGEDAVIDTLTHVWLSAIYSQPLAR